MTTPAIDFDEAAQRVEELVEELRRTWDSIVSAVNRALSAVPALLQHFVEPIRRAFEWAAAKVSEVFTQMYEFLTDRGSSAAIRAAGEQWNTQVGARASTQAGLLVKESLETDNQWQGMAAERYGEVVTQQNKALNQVKTITDTVQTTLNEVASALGAFWTGYAIATGAYVVSMAGCIVGAATVVAAVPALVAAAGFSATYIGAALTLAMTCRNALDEKKVKFDQQTTFSGTFAGQQWPSATAEQVSDGSVRDGDGSDWTPKAS